MSRRCRGCGNPIDPDRLAVLPDAVLCIGCARRNATGSDLNDERKERARRWQELASAEDDADHSDPYEAELEQNEAKSKDEKEGDAGLLAHDWYKWETVRNQALALAIKSIPAAGSRIDWQPMIEHCERYRMLEAVLEHPRAEVGYRLLYQGWLRPKMRETIEQELLDGQTQEDFEEGAKLERVSIDFDWEGLESDGELLEQTLQESEADVDGHWSGRWARIVFEDACLELAEGNESEAQEIYELVTVQTHAKDNEPDGATHLRALAEERGTTYDALRKRRARYLAGLKEIIGEDPRKYSEVLSFG